MEPRDLKALQDGVLRGDKVKYLFFWGHTPRSPNAIGKECLSQWWPSVFTVDGARYATAEHFMMAEKARLFSDHAALERILSAPHPDAAKRLGREVHDFDQARWDEARFEIVVRGNLAKFSQHPALCEFLVATGSRILVEASPRDAVWGIGLAEDDERAQVPGLWPGLNLLGFALMEVRARLHTRR